MNTMPFASFAPNTAARVAAAIAIALMLTGCDTGPLIRDNYWGKSVLQPDMVLRPAERDAFGNPVLDDAQ